jgi:hypothetical protein
MAAAPPTSVMSERRFTARFLPCFRQKGSTPQRYALRDFNPAYDRSGVIQRLLSRIAARPLSLELRTFCPQEPDSKCQRRIPATNNETLARFSPQPATPKTFAAQYA